MSTEEHYYWVVEAGLIKVINTVVRRTRHWLSELRETTRIGDNQICVLSWNQDNESGFQRSLCKATNATHDHCLSKHTIPNACQCELKSQVYLYVCTDSQEGGRACEWHSERDWGGNGSRVGAVIISQDSRVSRLCSVSSGMGLVFNGFWKWQNSGGSLSAVVDTGTKWFSVN